VPLSPGRIRPQKRATLPIKECGSFWRWTGSKGRVASVAC